MRIDLQVVAGRGAPETLTFEASSAADAGEQASRLGYLVLSAVPRGLSWSPSFADRRLDRPDIVIFVDQLRDLLGAGLSVVEALDTLRRGASGRAALMMDGLVRRLREGKALSDALEEQGGFPSLLVALVGASELTSDLPQTLERFLEHERRVAEVRHRLVSTAIYPLLLIGVGGLVLLFLLFYVMPRFARVFEGMHGELPWSARAMVVWTDLLRSSGSWGLIAGVVALVAAASLIGLPQCRTAVGRRLFEWQPIRIRLRTYFLAQWYRATGMLVQGGIPLATSLDLANRLLPLALRGGGEAVGKAIREGLSPAQAHVRAGMATPVAEQLLLAGERTGDLGAVLSRIAQFHEAEVSRSLERTMSALEPIVMVLVGLGVGIVVVLMYLPIFELASAIQ